MSNFKFTGANIAAALLILCYFFPWVSIMTMSLSGFSVTTNGVSPGVLSYFISGISRLFMILAIVVPVSGALILYQNTTGNKKFDKYYKPAHIVPAVYLVVGILALYFKMKPDAPAPAENDLFGGMTTRFNDMAPGAFDVLGFGVYLSLIAAIYLFLVNFGKITDREYYKPATAVTTTTPPAVNENIAPRQNNTL